MKFSDDTVIKFTSLKRSRDQPIQAHPEATGRTSEKQVVFAIGGTVSQGFRRPPKQMKASPFAPESSDDE